MCIKIASFGKKHCAARLKLFTVTALCIEHEKILYLYVLKFFLLRIV